jgi:hypothetical protein
MEWYLISYADEYYVARPGAAKNSKDEYVPCWCTKEGRVICVPEIVPGEVSISGEPDWVIPISTIEEKLV